MSKYSAIEISEALKWCSDIGKFLPPANVRILKWRASGITMSTISRTTGNTPSAVENIVNRSMDLVILSKTCDLVECDFTTRALRLMLSRDINSVEQLKSKLVSGEFKPSNTTGYGIGTHKDVCKKVGVKVDVYGDVIQEPKKPAESKPPIGLKPKYIHDQQRLDEILATIRRYTEAGLSIPIEWVDELNDLASQNNNN